MVSFSQVSNVENFSPQIIKRVAKELHELTSSPPEGIKIFMNDEDITNIQASIEGPGKATQTRNDYLIVLRREERWG